MSSLAASVRPMLAHVPPPDSEASLAVTRGGIAARIFVAAKGEKERRKQKFTSDFRIKVRSGLRDILTEGIGNAKQGASELHYAHPPSSTNLSGFLEEKGMFEAP